MFLTIYIVDIKLIFIKANVFINNRKNVIYSKFYNHKNLMLNPNIFGFFITSSNYR